MEKRAFLAIALSLLVLVAYQEWVARYYGNPPTVNPPAPADKQETSKNPSLTPTTVPTPPSAPRAEITPAGETGADVTIDTDNYIAVFSSQGARLKSFKFKKYRSTAAEDSPPFEIVSHAPGVALPLGIRWQGPNPFDDANVIYSVQGRDLKLTGDSKGSLSFQGRAPNGALITKKFTFDGATYPIGLEVSITGDAGVQIVPEVMLTDKSDQSVINPDAHFEGVIALVDNKIKRETPAAADKGVELTGDIAWAGFGHTYFFFALLPENGQQHKLSVQHVGNSLIAAVSGPALKPAGVSRFTLFIGPKDLDILESLNKGLERSIDFGYFGFISIPFRYVLHFFHRFTHSYGIDIILLTLIIKLLMAPLTHKSYVSMKQMQRLQPQMERLKERLKDDKEKLNKEIMELYRRNGVNPLGGCLPMVLQFPVFIGLYNALSTPLELRHAPFMWIKDLSRPDWQSLPFTLAGWHFGIPILTILMGASMFLQQWMTPSAGDPNQRKMMMLMPLVFTWMCVSFPAGLTVYWLVNNVLSIAQQYWINQSVK